MSIPNFDSLSALEKVKLIEQLWTSLEKDKLSLNMVQEAEIDRRLAKVKDGSVKWKTWGEVKNRLKGD